MKTGRTIHTFRKQAGLTLRQLGKRSRLDFANLSRIENGKRNPSIKSLRSIAKVLNVPVERLL